MLEETPEAYTLRHEIDMRYRTFQRATGPYAKSPHFQGYASQGDARFSERLTLAKGNDPRHRVLQTCSLCRWRGGRRWRGRGHRHRCSAVVHQILQLLAALAKRDLLGRHFDSLSRLGIAPDPRLALAGAETAKAADF